MNQKHSKYYNLDAKTSVKTHYRMVVLIGVLLGGGTIALMWTGLLTDNDFLYILSVILFLIYLSARYVPGKILQSVLYLDCDAKKMREIILLIENKVKNDRAKTIWKYMRVQATYYISGCEEESFQLLESCEYAKKTFTNQLSHLSLYLNHYFRIQDWDNYKRIRMELEHLPMRYAASKKSMEVYEHYLKGVIAKEKYLSGAGEEARKLCQELLASNAANRLNQVAIHNQLAIMDMEAQQYDSAKEHFMFVIENGGTTYFVDEAKEKMAEIGKDR